MPAEEAPKIGEELDLDWIHGSKVVPPLPPGGGEVIIAAVKERETA